VAAEGVGHDDSPPPTGQRRVHKRLEMMVEQQGREWGRQQSKKKA